MRIKHSKIKIGLIILLKAAFRGTNPKLTVPTYTAKTADKKPTVIARKQ